MSGDDFLSRWSRRKLDARAGRTLEEPAPATTNQPVATHAPAAESGESVQAEPDLPPVESLTPESDYTPFMRTEVDPKVRQQALRTLFRDPRFNVMDGLDVYIDDYSKPDPIPPDWLGKLNQMGRLGDYRPPEAAQEVAQGAPQDGAGVENTTEDQHVAEPSDALPSNTSATGDTPSRLQES